MSATRTCKYVKCGGPIPVTARADADFCRPEHKSAHHNELRREQGAAAKRLDPVNGPESGASAEIRPLAEVASDGELAERFRPLIRTAIFDRLKTTGVCHADDLADVYPEGHVDLCRHLATAHFGQLARRKLIEKTEWRKSSAPGRNGGGSWVWKFTKAGWDKYAGAGSSADASSSGVVDVSVGPGGTGSPETATQAPPSSGDPAAQLPDDAALELLPPADPEAWAA